jgi:hypothetical protein
MILKLIGFLGEGVMLTLVMVQIVNPGFSPLFRRGAIVMMTQVPMTLLQICEDVGIEMSRVELKVGRFRCRGSAYLSEARL